MEDYDDNDDDVDENHIDNDKNGVIMKMKMKMITIKAMTTTTIVIAMIPTTSPSHVFDLWVLRSNRSYIIICFVPPSPSPLLGSE